MSWQQIDIHVHVETADECRKVVVPFSADDALNGVAGRAKEWAQKHIAKEGVWAKDGAFYPAHTIQKIVIAELASK